MCIAFVSCHVTHRHTGGQELRKHIQHVALQQANALLACFSVRGPHVKTMAEACHMLSRMLSMRINWRSVWWQACPACPMHMQCETTLSPTHTARHMILS